MGSEMCIRDSLGGRTAIRAAQELQALAAYQESVKEARKNPFDAIKKAFD